MKNFISPSPPPRWACITPGWAASWSTPSPCSNSRFWSASAAYLGISDQDLVLAGLFLHDIAKTVELSYGTGFDYSDDGRLVGHVSRGAIWIEQKSAAVSAKLTAAGSEPLRKDLVMVLIHIRLLSPPRRAGEFARSRSHAQNPRGDPGKPDRQPRRQNANGPRCRGSALGGQHLDRIPQGVQQ